MQAWGEYRPDLSNYQGDSTRNVSNVLPRGDGYGPFPSVQSYTAALPSTCRGTFRALKADGTVAIFAGTATKMYLLDNTTLSFLDVSKPATSPMSVGAMTSIGNLTGGGGLAAAFDGTTAQAIASCASLAAVTSAYVGKTLGTPTCITSVNVFGSNDQGYVSGANPSVTIDLYAKQGAAPASSTDGTIIGTISFTDTADEHVARSITSNSNKLWDHCWVRISTAASSTLDIAELQIVSTFNYSLQNTDQWQFAQYGNTVIATEVGDPVQAFDLVAGLRFADLAGSPPQARYVAIVNDFVVLSGLGSNYNRIQWSSRGSATGWVAGVSESDFQDFFEGGNVLQVAGGEMSGIVLQDTLTRRMTYQAGSAVIFSFDKVADSIGLQAPLSLIKAGNSLFFLSNAGFMLSVDGSVPAQIGKERVDNTFLNEWDSTQPQLMMGFPDPRSTRVYWAYKTTGGTAGQFDKILCYDWVLQRWSRIIGIQGQHINALSQAGLTLEALDTTYPSIDAMTISLDAFPSSFGKEISVFDTSGKLGFLRGPALEAIMDTGLQGDPTHQTFISTIRPVTDAPTVFSSVSSQQKASDTADFSAEIPVDSLGQASFRVETRHFVVRNRIPANTVWAFSVGVEIAAVQTGAR